MAERTQDLAAEIQAIKRSVESVEKRLQKLRASDTLVADLVEDAKKDGRISLSIVGAATATALTPALVLAVRLRPASGPLDRSAVVIALAGAAFGVLLLMIALRYQASSRRSRVLAREILLLNEYEKPLTDFQSQMMRLALAPRIFSGTADQIDPLSDPEWTGMSDLARAFSNDPTDVD